MKSFPPEQKIVALLLAVIFGGLVLWRLLAWSVAPP